MLAGDAINTASRLQSVAPELGVAVGLGTFEATEQVFEYDELEPATLKGKAEPVRVFWAKTPRARFGTDVTRRHDTPFVGREIDLAILKGIFDKAIAQQAPQLVTIVGEPGVGKSRLVAELFGHVEERTELVNWRQGRCLPYGEGVTFWALGEILKAHTGILESDPPAVAAAKLDILLPQGDEREWFRQRLLPLLGIEATSSAARTELFTAWRRFLEHIAEEDPTVLVFEDLHWADPAMLDFLEHLADRAEGLPLLIVGTARPELFDHHPEYAHGLRNSTPINLAPLSAPETTRLVCSLLDTRVIPAELQTPILERSGGNPLYAEEFVRLLKDRNLLVRNGTGWELVAGADIPFPDSVQALIAARLDTLTPDRKTMLADAAVIGKVFWAGGVAAMGELDESDVVDVMHELTRKEMVRAARRSTMEGEAEYAFWHVLARDVAYAQIPRASRASRHVAAAAWIESTSPGRLEDHADVLAHHYSAALELAEASGQTDLGDLHTPAIHFLTLAGDRALGLDTAAALDAFERALVLTPPGHPDRAGTLSRFGDAARQAGRLTDAVTALEEAVRLLAETGEVLARARAIGVLSGVLQRMNNPRFVGLSAQALAELEGLPPGPELIDVLADVASDAAYHGRPEEGIELAERALVAAEIASLPRPARALGSRAGARTVLGDAGGLDDYREALDLAIQAGQGRAAALLYNNLGVALRHFEGARAALAVFDEGIAFSTARGVEEIAMVTRTSSLSAMLSGTDLQQTLTVADDVATHAQETGDEFDLIEIGAVQALVLTYLGLAQDASDLPELPDRLARGARLSGRPDLAASGLGCAAIILVALGKEDAAAELMQELATIPGLEDASELATYLTPLVRAAVAIGKADLGARLVQGCPPRYTSAEHALVASKAVLAEARGDIDQAVAAYADAASRWQEFGVIPEQGFALLGQGRCLLALADNEAAKASLLAARDIFTRCGMKPALAESDSLLAQATALTS